MASGKSTLSVLFLHLFCMDNGHNDESPYAIEIALAQLPRNRNPRQQTQRSTADCVSATGPVRNDNRNLTFTCSKIWLKSRVLTVSLAEWMNGDMSSKVSSVTNEEALASAISAGVVRWISEETGILTEACRGG